MSESISEKVAHVRSAQSNNSRHLCHWPGCKTVVPPALWGCSKHWYLLPTRLRWKIWGAYSVGQEIKKNPSFNYMTVAEEVQDWIDAQKLL